MNIMDLIKQKRIYLDGAFGTELIRRGFDSSKGDDYNITNPSIIRDIAKDYLDAGSDVVFTGTFGCNALKHRCDDKTLQDLILEGIKVTKSAVAGRKNKFVGYSAGPLPEMLMPYGKLSYEEAYRQYAVQAEAAMRCPPDFVVLETFTDVWMLKAAILAFKENSDLPVWCSMSFNDNGRTFSGAPVESYAMIAQGLGAEVLGINCGFGPDKMYSVAKRLTAAAHVPVYVKPNAGMPVYKNGVTSYDIGSDEFARLMAKIADLGVSILGGCCGTTPEYIKKTIAATKNKPFKLFDNNPTAVCSGTEVVNIEPFIKVGERINPTGKPRLKQALKDKNLDYIVSIANSQLEKGADILDVNVGMAGIDESAVLPQAVTAVQFAVNCPLMIDSSNYLAMKAALRTVNGVPIINSVNGSDESMDSIFPLAKKYGAYMVALCLDDGGIPDTAEGRISIAKHILKRAEDYGIDKSRFLFDALTMAVGVNTENANITIQTVKALKDMSLNTVLGLSNISFGLPAREIINGAFLKMAKDSGLTSAIVNPSILENDNPHAVRLLTGKDANCESYIREFTDFTAAVVLSDTPTLFDCVVKGLKNEALEQAKTMATADNYFSIINDVVVEALNEVGRRYENGRAFLPQLIISADAAGAALDYIKNKFLSAGGENGPVMLLATVKGDIHDIGKNIVKAVISNYGYKIYDLGRDVDISVIMDNVISKKPKFVGLSALMTTSLCSMRKTVAAIKNYDKSIIVMVGGAVVTEEFKDEIGADIYGKDAQDTVRKLQKYKF